MCRTEQLDDGEWIEDEEQVMQLKANFIISAFGSGLYDSEGKFCYMFIIPVIKINKYQSV